ncbi:MAG TPA: YdeI/OmpD-associated family protein [Polyangiaceae bacterium]|jgi:hypothetical protein
MAAKRVRPTPKKTPQAAARKERAFDFATRLEQLPGGGPYYVSIPAAVSRAIGVRGIVPVIASVNGVAEVRASMIPAGGGRHRLRLNAATRDAADARLGGRLSVHLEVDDNPVADPVPPDLARALRDVGAFEAFRSMPVGRQNHILTWLAAAAKEATREKRIAQIVEGSLAWQEDPRDRRWEGAGRG